MRIGRSSSLVGGTTVALACGFVAAYFGGAFTVVTCVDGDIKGESRQAAWCAGTVDTVWGLLVMLSVPLLLGAGAAVWLAERWLTQSGGRWLVAAVLAPALAVGTTVVVFHAPSDNCSTDQQAAYDAWAAQPDRDRRRDPPYDCEPYYGS